MPRQRKCVICGESILDENDSVPYKGRYAHSHCFDLSVKILQTDKKDKTKERGSKPRSNVHKPQIELKDALSEEEYADKKQYYSYLRSHLDNELNAKIYTLSDNYVKKYGFTFKDMYLTLVYLFEIKQREIVGDIVGLIPYYIDEAQQYYKSLSDIETMNATKDIDTMYTQKVVQIKSRKKQRKLLDITTIGNEQYV